MKTRGSVGLWAFPSRARAPVSGELCVVSVLGGGGRSQEKSELSLFIKKRTSLFLDALSRTSRSLGKWGWRGALGRLGSSVISPFQLHDCFQRLEVNLWVVFFFFFFELD